MPNTMHSLESNSSNVPAFLIKLWKLVEDPSCNDLIAWTDSGLSFIIQDQMRFSRELLPQYFKHNNMQSFIRQLNMYGFEKVPNYEKSGLKNENDKVEYHNSFFCKDKFDMLKEIKRKIPNARVSDRPVKSNPRDILTDLSSIREKQENMDNMLLKMKQENELLWRELTSMRQKHKAQEQIIQKVIQFLVSIVQRTNPNIGVQRKIPRMLHDSPGNQGKSQVIDLLRKKNSSFITVPQDKLASPLGPVIHEVTEFDHEQEVYTLSPSVKSPGDGTEISINVPESENQESVCDLNSSLNSPIDLPIEPLNILEPLQSSTSDLHDGSNPAESVLGLPLEYMCASPSTGICIPEETSDNVISLPDSLGLLSYNFPSSGILMCSSPKSDFEDSLMSTSLQTPVIPQMHIEDVCPSPASPLKKENGTSEKESIKRNNSSVPLNEHNYQLAVSDSSNAVVPTKLTKNTLSNHVISTEERLKSLEVGLEDLLKSIPWEYNENKLLELFSTDAAPDHEALAGEIAATIKTEPIDVVGNELVQFTTPSMLDCDLDIGSDFQYLNQDIALFAGDNKSTEDQKNFFLVDDLNIDQKAASEAVEHRLNGSVQKHKIARHPKVQKQQKAKRRKIK